MVEVNNPSWKIVCEVGEIEVDGTMPDEMEQIGWIKKDSFTPNHVEGQEKSIEDTELEVRFSDIEPMKVGWGMTLIGIPKSAREKFWDVKMVDGMLAVNSFQNNKEYAVRIYDRTSTGSEVHNYPRVKISLGMAYSTDDGGFTSDVKLRMLKPSIGPTLLIGKVGVDGKPGKYDVVEDGE